MDTLQPLDKFMPTSTDPNILNQLFKETPIQEFLSLEDLLARPVNDEYAKNTLRFSQSRFPIKIKSNDKVSNDV
jgi:sulfur transfer complex TusBCD TusB component (DsrH family)